MVPVTTGTADITVHRLPLADELVEAAWNELQDQTGVSNPFLSWQWYGALLDVPELAASTEVVLCKRGTRPIGLLPLETVEQRGVRRLGVAGWHWFTPDHLDVIAEPGNRGRVAGEIAAHLASRRDWDVLDIDALTGRSTLGNELKRAMRGPRYVVRPDEDVAIRTRVLGDRQGPVLSKGARKKLRREVALIEQDGGTLEMVTAPDTVTELLEELICLHQLRFGEESTVFATPGRCRFHVTAARRLSRYRSARIARLRVGGVDVALAYILTWGSTAYFYAGGLRPGSGRSPGFALRAWAVTRLAEEGFTTVDFLRGDHEWKQRLADSETHDTRVRIVRITPRIVVERIRRALPTSDDVGAVY